MADAPAPVIELAKAMHTANNATFRRLHGEHLVVPSWDQLAILCPASRAVWIEAAEIAFATIAPVPADDVIGARRERRRHRLADWLRTLAQRLAHD